MRSLWQVRTSLAVLMLFASLLASQRAEAQSVEEPGGQQLEASVAADPDGGGDGVSDGGIRQRLVVLPFRIHSARSLSYLTESLGELLAAKLRASGDVEVVEAEVVREALGSRGSFGLSDLDRRQLGQQLGVVAVVSGSLTELAGSFSLDVRVTPAEPDGISHTIVFATENEEDLIGRLDELAERVSASLGGRGPGILLAVSVEGAVGLEGELLDSLGFREGDPYDPDRVNQALERLEQHPKVARVSLETRRTADGVSLKFKIVRAEMIFGEKSVEREGEVVESVEIRGNRRIEADAIRTRISTQAGEVLNPAQVASDVNEIFGLGFFSDVKVLSSKGPEGVILTFEVAENPVIRQISISGNDSVDSDKIRDVLTLTTGSTLDYPLLHENNARVSALYRAEGYYLAEVSFEIEALAESSVAVHFEVEEREKLKLRKIEFEGNEALDDRKLREALTLKTWKFWSYATSWFDKSGTYSEPIFMRDLRNVEKLYTDRGYLEVEVEEPRVEALEEGLFVTVDVREGPQFRVGEIDVSGDATIDLEELRSRIQLRQGDVFNRSFLTVDVEQLESFYTDRGFYFASVNPVTRLSDEEKLVDVEFRVKKGPLYFIRRVNISGNTRTVDPVIRREMQVVEGQLYSARSLQMSNIRVRGLGFFEDVSFEPQPAEDPSQLDLDVNVVERPTGSFSFGAGFSSQDKLVFTASLSQANLFGRGYGVNLSADVGGRSNRFYLSIADPYFLDTNFSLSTTFFLTSIRYNDFEQDQRGFDLRLGHALTEDGRGRGSVHYSYAQRRIKQPNNVNTAAPLFREILQDNESTSMVGISLGRDTRDDRFSPTSGMNYRGTLEYAGLGGFANFLRVEGRFSWYMGAPRWLFKRSSFVFSTRIGYTLPLNQISDWSLDLPTVPTACDDPDRCYNIGLLDQIDTDVLLPLTDRYFLGGIGSFQLRGYKARSLGPRRPILRRSVSPLLFHPVGTQYTDNEGNPIILSDGTLVAVCNDVDGAGNQGNGNGRCNSIGDKDIEDFDDLRETDVIGGNKFITASFEYRFPISEEVGLQAVLFFDMGNAMYEGENLFDVREWRYGYGGGLLWFSPFGPLQLILGFPIDPLPNEKSPVFEFSVGGYAP